MKSPTNLLRIALLSPFLLVACEPEEHNYIYPYRTNPRFMGKRILCVGVEYGKIAAGNRVSQTTMLYMDKNRNIVARDWVSDKGVNLSVFLGVSI